MDYAVLASEYRRKPVFLDGSNFSGRTAILRNWCSECASAGGRGIYVGPNVHQSVSSLVPTVADELLLHASDSARFDRLLDVARALGLDRCYDQSPFTLSGGEQVLLVTLCKLGLGPTFLGLDGTIEELDRDNAQRVIELLSSELAAQTTTVLTSNGYSEDRHWRPAWRLPASGFDHAETVQKRPCLDSANFLFTPPSESGGLEVEDLSFSYEHHAPVLRSLNFRLEPGKIYSLEGRNGVGKSTLARILTGVLRLRRGRIVFNDRDSNPWKTPGRNVAMHFQNPDSQLFADSVERELVDLPMPARRAAAAFAGTNSQLTEHPFDLPFVLRKRLALSAVAHLSKPWFIFDEPTLGQDALASDEIVKMLRRMAEGGSGVVVISHSAEFIRRLNAKRMRLEDGQLHNVEPSAQITQ